MVNKNGLSIAETITEIGFNCCCEKSVVSPRFETQYFKLESALQINDFGKKQVKILEQIYHTRFFFDNNMVDYSFSLSWEKPNEILPFTFQSPFDMKHEKVYVGVDNFNNPVFLDFYNNVNHILIGGATGSGKSSFLNSIILGIILSGLLLLDDDGKPTPYIYLFDPKKVEFEPYNNCPVCHLETDTYEIAKKLEWLVALMETRYKRYQEKGFVDYKQAKERPRYVIIDELADLMMSGNETIEQNIIKLAQKGRGAGIHLIIATQNPIAKICTSLIKSNMTTRIALKCATKMQSIVMLDHIGAEKLLGKGDALLKLPNKVEETRLQGCFCPHERIKDLVDDMTLKYNQYIKG